MSGAPIDHPVTETQTAGELPQTAAAMVADRVLVAASLAFLFLLAFAGSAGLRATALLACACALAVRWREVRLRRVAFPRDVTVAWCAWALLGVASVAWSVDRPYTLGELRAELLYGALAFSVYFIAAARGDAPWRSWWIALAAGTALALVGQVLQDVLPIEISRHEVDGGPGPYSTQLVLVMPLLFALAWPAPWGLGRGARALAVAMACAGAAALYTGNRMVWLAFAAQIAVAALAWNLLPSSDPQRARMARRLIVWAGIVVAVAFIGSLMERSQRFFHHATNVAVSIEADLRPRIWSVAWKEFRQAPWFGHGFGREVLAPAFIPLTPPGPGQAELHHGHNTFVDVALELGVVGLAAYVALLLALLGRYRAMLRNPVLAPLGMMGIALVAGFVVKNLTDDFLHRHNALLFWALNGVFLGLARAARRA